MSQKQIEDFRNVYYIKSRTGEKVWEVTENRGIWHCPCPDFQRRGSWVNCWHIVQAQNEQLRKELDYYKNRKLVKSKAKFGDEFEVIQHYTYEDDGEFQELSRIALELARSQGYVTADCLRKAVQGQHTHLPCIRGSVLQSLKARGLLRKVKTVDTDNPLTHRPSVGYWVLTEEGEQVV